MAPKRTGGSMKWVAKKEKGEGAELEPVAVQEEAAKAPEEPAEVITSPLLLEPFTGPNYSAELLLRIRGQLGLPEPAAEEELAVHPYQFEDRVVPEPAPAASNTRERKKVSRQKSNVSTTEEAAPAGDAAADGSEVARTVSLSEATAGDITPMAQRGQLDPWNLGAYIQSMQYAAAALPPMYGAAAGFTTIMLRNIPNRYTREMLIGRLNEGYKEQYDFVYLPIDFNSKCNMGYAFINFRSPAICSKFVAEFNGQKTRICLPGFSSQKVCEVTPARVQGRDANMENLKDKELMEKLSERPEWQPLFLDDTGKEIPLAKALSGTGGRKRSKSGADGSSTAAMSMASLGFFPPYPPPMVAPWGMMGAPFGGMMTQEISITALLQHSGPQTTLMLRNVPTNVTRAELIKVLDTDFKGSYDFLWLPAETRILKEKDKDKDKDKEKDKDNDEKAEGDKEAEPTSTEEVEGRGFAFINLRTVKKGKQFQEKFSKAKVSEIFSDSASDKACEVAPARINTLDKSLNRLKADVGRGKQTTGKWPEWYPLLLGSTGELYPFPLWPGVTIPGASPFPSVPAAAVDSRSLEQKMEVEGKASDASAEKADAEGASSTTAAAEGSSATAATEAKPGLSLPVGPGFPAAPPYGMGYPGLASPVHAHAMAAAMAAASAAAQVQMQIYSNQASAQQAAMAAGLLDPLAQAVNPSAQLSKADQDAVRQQIEYYFGTDNLCKDTFLRSQMDPDGWVDLKLIATFNKVKAFRASAAEIGKALSPCELLELHPEGKKVRLRNEEKRKEFGNAFQVTEAEKNEKGNKIRKAAKAPSTTEATTTAETKT